MPNRNVDKGREAENAVAQLARAAGCPYAERRTKRGGYVELPCRACDNVGGTDAGWCDSCEGRATVRVPADAGDLTGIPGVVVQVKWSPYKPLPHDLQRTDEQRQAARADIGLLIRKRARVGIPRVAEWDAYLPTGQLAYLLDAQAPMPELVDRVWHTDAWTALRMVALAGFGIASPRAAAVAPSPTPY